MDMKTFNRGNLTTAVLLALTIGMSQPVFASDTVYEDAATKSADWRCFCQRYLVICTGRRYGKDYYSDGDRQI